MPLGQEPEPAQGPIRRRGRLLGLALAGTAAAVVAGVAVATSAQAGADPVPAGSSDAADESAPPADRLTGPSAVSRPTSTATGAPDPAAAETVARVRAATIERAQSQPPPPVPELVAER